MHVPAESPEYGRHKFVIAQRPNKSILVALVSRAGAALSSGWLADALYGVFVFSLAFWAMQEITRGINWFRRLLGVVVLTLLAVSLLRKM